MPYLSRAFVVMALFGLATNVAVAQQPPQATLDSLKSPIGWKATLWAAEPLLSNPTALDVDSRGRVWVAEGLNYRFFANGEFKQQPGADRIRILEDTDGDGQADKSTVFAENIYPVPMGLAIEEIWRDGRQVGTRVYTGNSPDLLLLEDTNGDDKADERRALLTGFGGVDHDHGVHGMTLGPDGKLYFTQGDGQHAGQPAKSIPGRLTFSVRDQSGRVLSSADLGTVLRVNRDGSQLERLAYRLRNDYECAVDSFGRVFASDNDDDGNQGARMVWIMGGGHYGYQTSPRHWAEERPGIVPKLVGTGNGSPGGIMVLEGDTWTALAKANKIDAPLAVFQLDAGTKRINLHPLTRTGAAFRTTNRVGLEGTEGWFRPIDATPADDGSILVADWYDAGVGGHRFVDQKMGRIYRLTATTLPPMKARGANEPGRGVTDSLVGLRSPNTATRFVARQTLLAEGPAARAKLLAAFRGNEPDWYRARVLFVLADLPETGTADVVAALADRDATVRETALRILVSDFSREAVVDPPVDALPAPRALAHWDQITVLARDPDAGVRRELVLACRWVDTAKAGPVLLDLVKAWDGSDRFYLEALRLAIRHREPSFLEQVFATLADAAMAEPLTDTLATPPFFPTGTNASFIDSEQPSTIPPGSAASRLLGVAWVMERPEALPVLEEWLARKPPAAVATAVSAIVGQMADPKAAELVAARFLEYTDPNVRRETLRLMAPRLASSWKDRRDHELVQKMFTTALADPDLLGAALPALAEAKITRFNDQLMAMATNETWDESFRALALETLGRLRHQPAETLADTLVTAAAQRADRPAGPLVAAALSAWAELKGADANGRLQELAGSADAPGDLRRRAVRLLARDARGAEALLASAASLPEDLKGEARFALANHANATVRRRAAKVLASAQAGRVVDTAAVLRRKGDVSHGAAVFARDRSDACIRCHRVEGVGQWVGPDLSSIGLKYDAPEMLYHIVNPSGAIGYNYIPVALELADGQVLTGLVIEESADRVVLKTATGERVVVPASTIENRQLVSTSIMPEKLADPMNDQDLADLVAYLVSLRSPTATAGEYFVRRVDVMGSTFARRAAARDGVLDLAAEFTVPDAQPTVELVVPIVSPAAQKATVVFATAFAVSARLGHSTVSLDGPRQSSGIPLTSAMVKLPAGRSELVVRLEQPTGKRVAAEAANLLVTVISQRAVQFDFDRAPTTELTGR